MFFSSEFLDWEIIYIIRIIITIIILILHMKNRALPEKKGFT